MQQHLGKDQFTQGTRTYQSTRVTADGTKIYTLSAAPATIINNTTGTSYDDTALAARVTTLEQAPAPDAYDDSTLTSLVSSLSSRVTTLESSPASGGNIVARGTLTQSMNGSNIVLSSSAGCTAGTMRRNDATINVPNLDPNSCQVITSHVQRSLVRMATWVEPQITKQSGAVRLLWQDGGSDYSFDRQPSYTCDFMVIS